MVNVRIACASIAKLDHIKCTHKDGEFRVTLDGLSKEREEAVAYYTDDFDDALGTAVHMSMDRCRELAEARHRQEGNVY